MYNFYQSSPKYLIAEAAIALAAKINNLCNKASVYWLMAAVTSQCGQTLFIYLFLTLYSTIYKMATASCVSLPPSSQPHVPV